jgi:hypothetical protein
MVDFGFLTIEVDANAGQIAAVYIKVDLQGHRSVGDKVAVDLKTRKPR